MFRYIAFAWDASSAQQCATANQLRARIRSAWICALDAAGLQVFAIDARDGTPGTHLLESQQGVVLGTIFNHGGMCKTDGPLRGAFSEAESAAILESNGAWLLANCWGNYVVFARDHRGAWAMKDPIGTLPCFVTSRDGVAIAFSAMTDCVDELELRDFTINQRFLDVWLVAGSATQEVDALHGVTQVRRGEFLCLTPDMQRRFAWSPIRFRMRDMPILRSEDAQRAFRLVVPSAIRNLASCHDHILLELSGGLDSSIVSAFLFDARPGVSAVTFSTDDGSSDARPWARIAFAAMTQERTTHTEVHADPTQHIGLGKLGYASAEPSSILATALLRASITRSLDAAPSTTAIFTGDGGDSLFGASCADLAAATYVARAGLDRRAFHIAAQVARHTRSTTWKVLVDAMRAKLLGENPAERLSVRNKRAQCLVAAAVFDRFGADVDFHPWLREPGVPQESRHKVGGLLGTPDYYAIAPHPSAQFPEVVMPLLSQLVVELCLRIPADVLFLDGRDRGLARRAFSGHVPTALLDRAWKDRPGEFHQRWLQNNAAWVRETLLDGVLVGAGFLDRKATERALSSAPQRSCVFPVEILSHVETELWARHWRL